MRPQCKPALSLNLVEARNLSMPNTIESQPLEPGTMTTSQAYRAIEAGAHVRHTLTQVGATLSRNSASGRDVSILLNLPDGTSHSIHFGVTRTAEGGWVVVGTLTQEAAKAVMTAGARVKQAEWPDGCYLYFADGVCYSTPGTPATPGLVYGTEWVIA